MISFGKKWYIQENPTKSSIAVASIVSCATQEKEDLNFNLRSKSLTNRSVLSASSVRTICYFLGITCVPRGLCSSTYHTEMQESPSGQIKYSLILSMQVIVRRKYDNVTMK